MTPKTQTSRDDGGNSLARDFSHNAIRLDDARRGYVAALLDRAKLYDRQAHWYRFHSTNDDALRARGIAYSEQNAQAYRQQAERVRKGASA